MTDEDELGPAGQGYLSAVGQRMREAQDFSMGLFRDISTQGSTLLSLNTELTNAIDEVKEF